MRITSLLALAGLAFHPNSRRRACRSTESVGETTVTVDSSTTGLSLASRAL